MTTRTLYHHTLLPTARKVRLALHEKRLAFNEVALDPFTPSDELLALNPAGELPVLVDENEIILCDTPAICEYLEETYPQPNLLGRTPKDRAEARRLAAWFDPKFSREVTQHLAGEKLSKRVEMNAGPACGPREHSHAPPVYRMAHGAAELAGGR
jgi:glutathione S-transferase